MVVRLNSFTSLNSHTAQATVALFGKDGLASHTNFGIKSPVLYKFRVSFFRKQCKFEDSDRSKHVSGTVAKTLATSLATELCCLVDRKKNAEASHSKLAYM
jgi:hypothetical protein